VHRGRRPVVLVAHSLGVVTAVQAADQLASRVVGAFLVTPPDVSAPGLPQRGAPSGHCGASPCPFRRSWSSAAAILIAHSRPVKLWRSPGTHCSWMRGRLATSIRTRGTGPGRKGS
jgi:pimeloyl-ACP methyl ester carboxylesterase